MILGIGNDLVDCRRIEKTMQRYGPKFLNRVFTPEEQQRMDVRSNQVEGYSKLFAMKEALLKALGTGLTKGIVWQDIKISRESKSAPSAEFSGKALEILNKLTPNGYTAHLHVSVSDEWPYAQAFAIVSATPKFT